MLDPEGCLDPAVYRRGRIGIAIGLVMAQLGVDADDAFDALKRASQDSNRKLYVVAEEVIGWRRLDARPQRVPKQHADARMTP